MKDEDLTRWSEDDLRRWLKHFRARTFWDDADQERVKTYGDNIEAELRRRGLPVDPA